MKHQVAIVGNVRRLTDSVQELQDREPTTPGIAVIYGTTGYGKTTATKWLAIQLKAVFVRALATWTAGTMLKAIMQELGADPLNSSAEMVGWIARELSATGRSLFIDEADYLTSKKVLVETLRDIHDLSTQPLVLVGMAEFRKSVTHRAQLAGRVSQVVEFLPASFEDVNVLAKTLCDVDVDAELLAQLHQETHGSIRGLVVGLSRLETHAKRNGLKVVSLQNWGKKSLTLLAGSAK
jgi:DNA transposition AAA+ family ATPase